MSQRMLPLVAFAAVTTVTTSCAHPSGTSAEPRPAPASSSRGTVTASDISQQPGKSIEEVLAGRIAGVQVGRDETGALTVRVRGGSSINGSNEPLYVIDGVSIQPGPGGSLAGINPSDIESIQVLRDAMATAAYGVRGANGVIVIKMKKPGRPQWS
jgi:TonB-dependent starch-binding outer membrane protein SusC